MGRGNNRKSRKMVQRTGQAKKKARFKKLIETKRATRKGSSKSTSSAPKISKSNKSA